MGFVHVMEDLDHVLTTFLSPLEFIPSTFRRSFSSMKGPFFTLRGILVFHLQPILVWTGRHCGYWVAFPRRRPRTMY